MAEQGTYDARALPGYTDDILTDRFRLTPMRDNHEDGFWLIRSDPDVVRYLPYPLATDRNQHKQDFLKDLHVVCRYKHGWAIEWLDENEGDDIVFVGFAILRPTDDGAFLEVGYSVRKAFWGLGIASEVNAAITNYAEDKMGYPKQDLMATVEVGNHASRSVLEKSGYCVSHEKMIEHKLCWHFKRA